MMNNRKLSLSFLVISVAFFAISGTVRALDCVPLDPREQVEERVKHDIEGSAETLFKIGKFSATYKGETETEVWNLYEQYPNADKLIIKSKLIYTFCTILDSAEYLSPERQFEMFTIFSNQVMGVPVHSEKIPTSKEHDSRIDSHKLSPKIRGSLNTTAAKSDEISQGEFILSPNGRFILTVNKGGEVEICKINIGGPYKCDSVVWRSNTSVQINDLMSNDVAISKLVMQTDGNLAIYVWNSEKKGVVICASGPYEMQGSYSLRLNNSGTAVIYGLDGRIWDSKRGPFKCASQKEVDKVLSKG